MLIENEFTVNAPIEQTWKTLLDVPGIALCLPGARLVGTEGDSYLGKVKIKVGPVTAEYGGTARFVERDEANHHARIEAKGTESRGAGTAIALIDTRLVGDGAKTTVVVSTDLTITGKLAQFGRGMIEDISNRLLKQFSDNLEAKLAAEPATSDAGSDPSAEPADASPSTADDVEPLDVLALTGGSVLKRVAPLVAAVVAVLIVARVCRRRG